MPRQISAFVTTVFLVSMLLTPASGAVTELISVPGEGVTVPRAGSGAAVSADGRYVVFQSYASGEFCGALLRDRWTATTEYVSLNLAGQPEAAGCQLAISADGSVVAFTSWADTIVSGDTNGDLDVFVYDRGTGAIERVNVADDGTEADETSALWDLAISADGRYVAFISCASNLVPGDFNGAYDVFLRDRLTGTTERVSVSSAGFPPTARSTIGSTSGTSRTRRRPRWMCTSPISSTPTWT